MRTILLKSILCGALSLAIAGCSDDNDGGNVNQSDTPVNIEVTSSDIAVVEKCNNFGFKVMKEVNKNPLHCNDNVILSPLSINYAMSLLANGAEGETLEQIVNTLGYQSLEIKEVNELNKKLTSQLNHLDPDIKLNVANSVWSIPEYEISSDYTSKLKDYYNAEVKEIHYDSYAQDVNKWCSDNTNGKISKLLPDDSYAPGFALFNALYFKGLWNDGSKFKVKNTKEGYFNDIQGSRSTARFMNGGAYLYSETPTMQKCELYFGNKSFRAAFILPRENTSIDEALSDLSEGGWEELRTPIPVLSLSLSLPKFQVENTIDLTDVLTNLGMTDVFGNGSDFSLISNKKISMGDIKQTAVFEITEDGAEGAAVTHTGDGYANLTLENVELVFDRPFIYVVYEQSTGAILFTGIINTFAK